MNCFYGKTQVKYGNYITKQNASKMPEIIVNLKPKILYTVLIIDPDAVGGNKIHFLLINHSLTNNGTIIFPYVGPDPPNRSGVHRYYFLLIEQESLIFFKIALSTRYISLGRLFCMLGLPNNSIIMTKHFTSHA